MSMGLLGRKIGMTRVFDDKGNSIPVCVIEAGPCFVTQIKTHETDSYSAVQVGFDRLTKEKNGKKPLLGHFKKAGVVALKLVKEFRYADDASMSQVKLGQEIKVDIFKPGDRVDVTGWSKGRGFQGVVKRHGFRGLRATHGANEYFRRPGSIGTNTYGSNVKKGKKFPGHYGDERVTVLDLEVVQVDSESNLLAVRGGVPGAFGGALIIRKTNRG